MGIGIAFPRMETAGIDSVTLRLDWQKAMAALFSNGDPLELVTASGETRIVLAPADPTEARRAFAPSRWIGPSQTWASVTPVVFARHPKPHFQKDPAPRRTSLVRLHPTTPSSRPVSTPQNLLRKLK